MIPWLNVVVDLLFTVDQSLDGVAIVAYNESIRFTS